MFAASRPIGTRNEFIGCNGTRVHKQTNILIVSLPRAVRLRAAAAPRCAAVAKVAAAAAAAAAAACARRDGGRRGAEQRAVLEGVSALETADDAEEAD